MAKEKCDEHSGCTAKIENLEKSDEEQWKVIRSIQNRPPIWATAAISFLTFLLGCSITYAAIIEKIAELKK